jgi:outer membrane protein W/outer membrane protein OmpA-like peptidoglycan-associated protein
MKLRMLNTLGFSVLSVVAALSAARADDGPWEVRLRGVYLEPANKSDAIPGLAPRNAIHINDKWLPDLDFEYFFTPNWSTELVLTYPQSQTVTVSGTSIGTFKHLPPVLTAKYNFLPDHDFQPYVGAGINVTSISKVNLAVPGVGELKLNSTSVGPALQTGFDYRIRDHWYLNADVKWFKLGSDLKLAGGTKVSTLHIDPFLFGIGVGYRFGGREPVATAVPVPAPVPAPPTETVKAVPPPPPPAPCQAPAGFKMDENCHIIDQAVIVRAVDFEFNLSRLTAPAQQTLDEVASALLTQPGLSVEIQGHTDSVGSVAYNLNLSQRRADAVKAYLVSRGVSSSTLTAKGYGKARPIASNDTAEGRTQNRRVAFVITNAPAHVNVVSEDASAASSKAAEQAEKPKTKKRTPPE